MASGAAAPKESWGAAALGRLRREQEREAKRARDEVDRAVLGERVSGDDEWERKCAAVRAGMAAAGFSVRRAITVTAFDVENWAVSFENGSTRNIELNMLCPIHLWVTG